MEASGKTTTAEPSAGPLLIGSSGDSLREAFGKTLVQLAPKYSNFVVFDADIAGGTGVHHFRKAYPQRFFQFGIAEQNMMAAAGGFASTGTSHLSRHLPSFASAPSSKPASRLLTPGAT
jgi:transketolase C-terminal domain/subunit